jgi:hypothetical protein
VQCQPLQRLDRRDVRIVRFMGFIIIIALLLPGLVFLCAVVVSLVLHPRGTANAHRDGICDRCGYDLTGNTSGKCPECGLRIAPKRAVI